MYLPQAGSARNRAGPLRIQSPNEGGRGKAREGRLQHIWCLFPLRAVPAGTQGQDRNYDSRPPSLPLELYLGIWEPSASGGKIEAIMFVAQLCTFMFEARKLSLLCSK